MSAPTRATRLMPFRRRGTRAQKQELRRAGEARVAEGDCRRAAGARRVPRPRHAAGLGTAGRIFVRAEVGDRARRHSGGAGFVELLAEVARRRTDPGQLPGLAAQIPDSPLVQWLHSSGQPLPGDLRVVAGDMDGDSVTSWVKTLLADAFFWTDNDLVVQTRSMYGGSPRSDATLSPGRGRTRQPLQLLRQRSHGRRDRECAGAGPPGGFRRDWSALVERHVCDRRRAARGRSRAARTSRTARQ